MKGAIFIHGILQRTGTNLLNQILLLHPHCIQPVVKIRENWFLHNSDPLFELAEQLFQSWSNPRWGGDEFSPSELYTSMGNSLLDYLSQNIPDMAEKYLLTKTPDVQNLIRFFALFPLSKLIIIVRNPLDVATSAYNSWQHPLDASLRKWDAACKSINTFECTASPDQYLIIRFEDLVANPDIWTRKCLDYLGLDASLFPWQSLDTLPIYGSSEDNDWKIKETDATFQPVGRWKTLPPDQLKRLNHVSSIYQNYFGYAEFPSGKPCPLPDRCERLNMATRLHMTVMKDPRTSGRRIHALKTGLSFITEAILGRKVSTLFRTRSITHKDINPE